MAEATQTGVSGAIWLFDRRDYWRAWGRRGLEEAGFAVSSWSSYDGPSEGGGAASAERPALVVLSCSVVRDAEVALVRRLGAGRYRILVLAMLAPWEAMRALFLAGAYDVAEMPSSPGRLRDLVLQALAPAPPSSGYQPLVSARVRR